MNNLAMHAVFVTAIAWFDVAPIKRIRSTKGRAEIKCGLTETLGSGLRVAFIIISVSSQIHAYTHSSRARFVCRADIG